jgi:hypothetical protein
MVQIVDRIVKVNISRNNPSITEGNFGTVLIVGNTLPTGQLTGPIVTNYTSIEQIAAAYPIPAGGVRPLEYDIALAVFSQTVKPDNIVIVTKSAAQSYVEAYEWFVEQNQYEYFCVVTTSTDRVDKLALAAVIATQKKIFALIASAANIVQAGTTDLLSELNVLGYYNCYLVWTSNADNHVTEAGWFSRMAEFPVGSANWAYKDIVGVPVSTLTLSQYDILKSKNGNAYVSMGGRNVTLNGVMVNGESIDVIYGLLWLENYIQNQMLSLLFNTPKIP